MKLVESALSILEEAVARDFNGNLREAARFFDISYQTMYAWLKSKTLACPLSVPWSPPSKSSACRSLPTEREAGRPVCFVDAGNRSRRKEHPPPGRPGLLGRPPRGRSRRRPRLHSAGKGRKLVPRVQVSARRHAPPQPPRRPDRPQFHIHGARAPSRRHRARRQGRQKRPHPRPHDARPRSPGRLRHD